MPLMKTRPWVIAKKRSSIHDVGLALVARVPKASGTSEKVLPYANAPKEL
jgi:hypothetical protein